MENAADALKLAFGVFVFLLGLTILFSMSSLAKETARILISESDKTNYYEYYDEDDMKSTVDGNRKSNSWFKWNYTNYI